MHQRAYEGAADWFYMYVYVCVCVCVCCGDDHVLIHSNVGTLSHRDKDVFSNTELIPSHPPRASLRTAASPATLSVYGWQVEC